MEKITQNNTQETQNINGNQNQPMKFYINVAAASLIFGLLGGLMGGFYAFNSPNSQKLFGANQILNKNITISEDSAVIDVVKNASPAVVSIVVSKDLSKIPGYGMSPFDQDPFFNFFFNGLNDRVQSDGQPKSDIQEVGAGSGFFISADGLILTNKHVVSDSSASYTVLTSDGKKYDAKVLAEDPVNDLAIVKINISNAKFLQMADSSKIQIGQRVIAIGNSLGLYQNTVTTGIVSGVGRKITAGGDTGTEQLSGVIQTDAAINPGNSGGPLLDISGQVIGVNTAIDLQGQLVGFAIPSNEVSKSVEAYQKKGRITRPFLGVRYIILNSDLAKAEKLPRDFGALIVRGQNVTDFAVQPGSPADKAGIVENDIILELDGKKIDAENNLSDLIKNYNVGDKITLKIYHKGNEKKVDVVLGESK